LSFIVSPLLVVFIAVTAIQVLYYLFFFSRVAFYKFKESKVLLPPVTVIICAKDEVNNLRRNLPFLCTQDYPADYEILVVNDSSQDGTMELLFDLGREYDKLDYRTIPTDSKVLNGKKFALTVGVKAAKYENIILTDADCKPSSSIWLQKMASRFSDKKKIVLGFGSYEKGKGLLNACIRYETFFSALQYLSFALSGLTYMGVGRNLAYTRTLFFSQNIFVKNPRLISGDDDLLINAVSTSTNTSVCIHKDGFTESKAKEQWDEWLYQKRRHMTTAPYYKWYHIFFLTLFQVTHILFYPLLMVLILYSNMYTLVLSIFGVRLLLMGLINFFAMKKLKTLDLFIWFPIFDVLYLIYYFTMLPGIFNKKQTAWK
jgi:glycosyltransferase involved in cell wall biosynthesis